MSLAEHSIGWRWIERLGGLRHARADSANDAWRNTSFRGYADYMQTDEFLSGLNEFMELAATTTTALMCAEAVPWRCHRALVSDALSIRGYCPFDIMSPTKATEHSVTSFAHVDGTDIWYPAS